MSKQSELVNLIFTTTGSNVYFDQKPNGVKKCFVWHQISSNPVKNHQMIDHEKTRFQIDCYGDSFNFVETTASMVIAALDNNKTNFIYANYLNGFMDVDSETGLYRFVLDFMVE